MKRTPVHNFTLAAFFLALGLILPFVTGQIPAIGQMLLPMHIPVLLCGLICGGPYGALVGLILPGLRYVLFGMPPLFPTGLAMSVELMTYGFVAGYLFHHSKWQCVRSLYRCLLAAMLAGRITWGIAQVLLLGLGQGGFGWTLFISGAFINGLPGILLQIVLIPAIMVSLDKAHVICFQKDPKEETV